MTRKTATQISRMKQQTFGVEIEFNAITRYQAIETIAEYMGARNIDRRIERGDRRSSIFDQNGREWKIQKDSSIRGPEEEKCELITPVLTYEDIPRLQGLARALRHAGAKSCPSRGCGVHVHVGLKSKAGDHNAKTLRNLVNIMAAHEEQIGRAIKLDSRRRNEYCRVVNPVFLKAVNQKKPKTMEALADCWYQANNAYENREMRYNGSRYHMLNLHAAFTKGTVEFRLFQFDEASDGRRGGIHAGELKAYIQLCLAISELAKEVRFASPSPQQVENERYAFRCWMLRLGFIGDEFKTARTILLRNMTGDCAWRNGNAAEC